jgi:hypothetical protein
MPNMKNQKVTVRQLAHPCGWWVVRPQIGEYRRQHSSARSAVAAAAAAYGIPESEVIVRPFVRRVLPRLPNCHTAGRSLRGEEFKHEHNDCTVVAYATAFGVPYSDAHRILAASGRADRKGWYPERAICGNPRAERCDHRVDSGSRGSRRSMTLRQFVAAHPVGTYYLSSSNHSYVLYDGMTFDHTPHTGREIIWQAWRILDKT